MGNNETYQERGSNRVVETLCESLLPQLALVWASPSFSLCGRAGVSKLLEKLESCRNLLAAIRRLGQPALLSSTVLCLERVSARKTSCATRVALAGKSHHHQRLQVRAQYDRLDLIIADLEGIGDGAAIDPQLR